MNQGGIQALSFSDVVLILVTVEIIAAGSHEYKNSLRSVLTITDLTGFGFLNLTRVYRVPACVCVCVCLLCPLSAP